MVVIMKPKETNQNQNEQEELSVSEDDENFDESFNVFLHDFSVLNVKKCYKLGALSGIENKINTNKVNTKVKCVFTEKCKMILNEDDKGIKLKDKSDRATVEQVLDPRTMMILFKLVNKGFITSINGCVSTGKEANVYYATSEKHGDLAVKIYKTSILTFKDRQQYVTGEYRWRSGYCRKNPRKMVKLWAEKEFRNLLRMAKQDIPCPKPLLLKNNILFMTFVGENGWPCNLLHDAELTHEEACSIYFECVIIMWKLYRDCKLVHADFSAFNIMLTSDKKPIIIDVSQSVEHEHPRALHFLRRDALNISNFFLKWDVLVLSVQQLFDFIVDTAVTHENKEDYLNELLDSVCARPCDSSFTDSVFQNVFIPQNLSSVVNFENDIDEINQGLQPNLLYPKIIGMRDNMSDARTTIPPIIEDNANSSSSTSDDLSSSSENEDDGNDTALPQEKRPKCVGRVRNESPNSKKLRKCAVKEENREKRKNKRPKRVKRRKEEIKKRGHKLKSKS